MKRATLYIALAALMIASASPAKAADGSFWGTVLGGAIGGHIGSTIGKGDGNLAATALGTVIGAGIGNSMGRSMDRANRARHYHAPQQVHYYAPPPAAYRPNYVAPINQQRLHPHQYTGTPPRKYGPPRGAHVEQGYMGKRPPNHLRHGRQCREYTQTIRIGDQIQESYGIACLRPDGSWQVQQ